MIEFKKYNSFKILQSEKRKAFFNAHKGLIFWKRIINEYKLNKTNKDVAIILLPADEDEMAYFSLLYADRLLQIRELSKVLFLTEIAYHEKAAKIMVENLLDVKIITREESNALLQYFAMEIFDFRFFSSSLIQPNGRNGKALLGVCDITPEEMLAIGIYRIIPYVQKKRPVYSGDDLKLKEFMSIPETFRGKRTKRIIQ